MAVVVVGALVNCMEDPVDADSVWPLYVTFQVLPDGNPVSENVVMQLVECENAIVWDEPVVR